MFTVGGVCCVKNVYCVQCCVKSVYCGKMFTVCSIHQVKNVYCGWCLLWEKCLVCAVFNMLYVSTVRSVCRVESA